MSKAARFFWKSVVLLPYRSERAAARKTNVVGDQQSLSHLVKLDLRKAPQVATDRSNNTTH
jgi:hypothetical protein